MSAWDDIDAGTGVSSEELFEVTGDDVALIGGGAVTGVGFYGNNLALVNNAESKLRICDGLSMTETMSFALPLTGNDTGHQGAFDIDGDGTVRVFGIGEISRLYSIVVNDYESSYTSSPEPEEGESFPTGATSDATYTGSKLFTLWGLNVYAKEDSLYEQLPGSSYTVGPHAFSLEEVEDPFVDQPFSFFCSVDGDLWVFSSVGSTDVDNYPMLVVYDGDDYSKKFEYYQESPASSGNFTLPLLAATHPNGGAIVFYGYGDAEGDGVYVRRIQSGANAFWTNFHNASEII